ncbi:MAG: hypothetical protein IPF40_06620 [Actinomycetales bacterium]|uniref:GerMN domain-containing protein n=1 Tax=Candidatus Phosphoribacter hodrii TaxID=2953743 RepID=A0A935CDA7_9MICO|nr:hypothetical protein [Candidatus Phosphoribacter hodrii]
MRPRRGYAVPRGIQTGAAAARQRRRAFSMRGVVAVLVALAVGACSGLPTSSPVQSGRSVDEQVLPEVRIVVPPPAAGASPEQIVRGFLRAGAAFQESTDSGQPVANAYLAPGSVGRWRPTSSVTVFDRSRTVAVEALTGDKVRASVAVVATVDDTGHYREVAPGTVAQVDLGLVRVSGEWRVELPADGFGLWLNTDDFGRVFDPHRVHYPTVGGRHLVPDVRWFAGGPRLGTALARAQLGPVPDYLAGAVETGFPADVTLAVDAVSVDAGIATVVLTPPASAMDLAHRRAIWAQLVATLLRVPGVQGVVVEVQGAGRLVVPEVTGPLRSATDVGYGADPLPLPRTALLRLGERLTSVEIVRLDDLDGLGTSPTATATVAVPSAGAGDGPAPPGAGADLPTIPAAYGQFAVSADGADVVAVTPGGTEAARWHDRERASVPVLTSFVRPSYDAHDRLWFAGSDGGVARVLTVNARAPVDPAVPVVAPWLDGRAIVALAVSRDGSRVGVVSSALGGTDMRLDIAGVVRDSLGRPTALAAPYRQADPLSRITDVVWIDDTTLAALGAVGDGEALRPWIVQLGQGIGLRRIGIADPATNLIPVAAGARYLVSTSGPRGIVIVAQPGGVLVRVGGSWRGVEGVTEIAVAPSG